MQSEVAKLRQELEDVYLGMVNGLRGLSSGGARHVFIHQKMREAENVHCRLTPYVGDEQATEMVCNVFDQVMNEEKK
ncbi:MAG TPA: hypothetical protein VL461_09455 [Dictyobacter sp.]|nr:hypothetical protein [Dictyobacter sp.]